MKDAGNKKGDHCPALQDPPVQFIKFQYVIGLWWPQYRPTQTLAVIQFPIRSPFAPVDGSRWMTIASDH
jgi:hypothetical protein